MVADLTSCPHRNRFYRVGKYTAPLLSSSHIPPAHYLNKLAVLSADLGNYVLKPSFSFAGQAVLLHVKKTAIEELEKKERTGSSSAK